MLPGAAVSAAPPKPESGFTDLGKSRLVIVRIVYVSFWMGTNQVLAGKDDWSNEAERPAHPVIITKDFWMGQFPVTQRQWMEVMGNNPSYFQQAESDAPVEQVNWNDVQGLLVKLNALQNQWRVRLPTEAEWEYAARAGTRGEAFGPLDEIVWYRDMPRAQIQPVGKKLPNAFGLYDMLGNVGSGARTGSVHTRARP